MAYAYNPFTGKLDKVGGSGSESGGDAKNVAYTTPDGRDISVADELDSLHAKVFPIEIKSFTVNNTSSVLYEVGKQIAVNGLALKYELSAKPSSISITGIENDLTGKEATATCHNTAILASNVATTKTAKLTVKDASNNEKSKSVSVAWGYRRYAMCHSESGEPSSANKSAFITLMKAGTSAILTSKSDSVALTPSGEQYLWYAIPQGLTTSPSFKLNSGFEVLGGMKKAFTADITNEHNLSVTYDFYVSINSQAGQTKVILY